MNPAASSDGMNTTSASIEYLALSARSPARNPIVQKVSQVVVELEGQEPLSAFYLARERILGWLERRAGQQLPPEAWKGAHFELEGVGAQRAAVAAIENPRYWAARLDDADKAI